MRPDQSGETTSAMRDASAALALCLLLMFAGNADSAAPVPPAQTEPPDNVYEKAKGDALDAYIAGRLITAYALSEHLSPFALGVEVKDRVVMLSGVVENTVQRDLAIETARRIEQAREVNSSIRVNPAREQPATRSAFAQRVAAAGYPVLRR